MSRLRDELRGERGDAGEPADEVERNALAAEDGARRPLDCRRDGARLDRVAVAREPRETGLDAHHPERRLRRGQPRDDGPLAEDEVRLRVERVVRRLADDGRGRHVAAAKVLVQRAADDVLEFARHATGVGHGAFLSGALLLDSTPAFKRLAQRRARRLIGGTPRATLRA